MQTYLDSHPDPVWIQTRLAFKQVKITCVFRFLIVRSNWYANSIELYMYR